MVKCIAVPARVSCFRRIPDSARYNQSSLFTIVQSVRVMLSRSFVCLLCGNKNSVHLGKHMTTEILETLSHTNVLSIFAVYTVQHACVSKFCCDSLLCCTHTQDALRVIQSLLHAANNAMAMSKLRGCPISLDGTSLLMAEEFNMYTTEKRKVVREMVVFLHHQYIVFAVDLMGGKEYDYWEHIEVL